MHPENAVLFAVHTWLHTLAIVVGLIAAIALVRVVAYWISIREGRFRTRHPTIPDDATGSTKPPPDKPEH
jgi:hypothetical protein